MNALECTGVMKHVHLCELNEFRTRFYVHMSLSCTVSNYTVTNSQECVLRETPTIKCIAYPSATWINHSCSMDVLDLWANEGEIPGNLFQQYLPCNAQQSTMAYKLVGFPMISFYDMHLDKHIAKVDRWEVPTKPV